MKNVQAQVDAAVNIALMEFTFISQIHKSYLLFCGVLLTLLRECHKLKQYMRCAVLSFA